MFINQSARGFIRPMILSQDRRHWRQKAIGLLGPKVVWMEGGKMVLFFCLLLLGANVCLSAYASRIAAAVQEAGKDRYLLVDENITLRAERAYLLSPGYLEEMAARRFALYVPEKRQVFRF